jgi:hypothetical protein
VHNTLFSFLILSSDVIPAALSDVKEFLQSGLLHMSGMSDLYGNLFSLCLQ